MCYIKQENMVEKRKNRSESTDEDPMPEHEIVKDTLGHRCGYVKGMVNAVTKARGECSHTDRTPIDEKLAELDTANEKIVQLAKENETQAAQMVEMKLHMERMQKLLMTIPAVRHIMLLI